MALYYSYETWFGIYDWLGSIEKGHDVYHHKFSKTDFDMDGFVSFLKIETRSPFLLIDIANQKAIQGRWSNDWKIIAASEEALQAYFSMVFNCSY